MEKQNKTTKKLISLFWFVVYTMPLFIFICNVLMFYFNKSTIKINQDTFNAQEYTNLYNNIANNTNMALENTSNMFEFINESFIFTPITQFINKILGTNSTSNIIIFTSQTMSWYIMAKLLHIIIDFVMILPNICKKLFRKAGLDNE